MIGNRPAIMAARHQLRSHALYGTDHDGLVEIDARIAALLGRAAPAVRERRGRDR